MGIAILSGILSSLAESKSSRLLTPSSSQSGTATPAEDLPTRLPSRFVACVKHPQSAKKVTAALSQYGDVVTTLVSDNITGARQADVVLLACEPAAFREILGEEGMREALKGKLLISILAGVKASQLETHLYGENSKDPGSESRCRIVSALPNTAAAVRESMTYVANSTPPLTQEQTALVDWIFGKIGKVAHLPAHLASAATALCGSGVAFMAVVLEAMADGAVAMGVPRADAQAMAAQVMRYVGAPLYSS